MDDKQLSKSIFSYHLYANATVLCLNSHGNQLIAAGQQNFQLLAIEQKDQYEHFVPKHDFKSLYRQQARAASQPKDIGWSPNEEHCFASASTTGLLNIWDANQPAMINQFKIHNATINRLQFHPNNPKLLLTASQDGYAKLIDFRTYNTNKVVASFRHVSEDGFRDIHINSFRPDLFAAALNDQCIVPLWDMRKIDSPVMVLTTADRTLCLAWNCNEPAWLATGGRDRTIRIWNAQDSNSRQEPLFKVQSFGTVSKLSWRPNCRFHIACSTLSIDPRIHVWDIRRPYLPQASFCHHQNSIGEFRWRANTDNLVSVGHDEYLYHAHLSTALKTDRFVSLFSLNVTPKGEVFGSMPNINDDYIRAIYAQKQVAISYTNLKEFYSQNFMAAFSNWTETIRGRSVIGIYRNPKIDNSVELFHRFARHWIFGNGDKSSESLRRVCDHNSTIAEKYQRPDLQATWKVIKMLFTDPDQFHNCHLRSSKTTSSTTKTRPLSDSFNNHRHHYHYQYHQTMGKLNHQDQQQDDNEFNNEFNDKKRTKSQEQIMQTNNQMEMIEDSDTYIVRDVLMDDILFITPEDAINNTNNFEILCENEIYSDIHDGLPMMTNETPSIINGETDGALNRLTRQCQDIILLDESAFGPVNEYDSPDGNMRGSTNSILPDGSDNFFTIDESYCPTMQNHPLIFDDIIRKTIWYYVENNELQVAVHLLLALYPTLGHNKIFELFNGAYYEWIGVYIDLLQKLRLFVKAKQVTKHCIEKEKIPLNYDSSEYDGTMILTAQSPTSKRSTTNSVPVTNKNQPATPKDFICSICRIPCRGIYSFCGVCFHGGHIDHIKNWFNHHDECPYGCGHRCKDRDTQNRRSRGISQRFTSRSSFVLQQ